MSLALLPVTRQLFVRSILWALVGAIYAPLFVVLQALLAPHLGGLAFAAAATGAGAVGAAYYSARQAALVASLIGVVATLFVLIAFHDQASFWHAAVTCGALGVMIGLRVEFPSRCTANVVGKSLLGGLSGALSGGLLSLMALSGVGLSPVVAVAFLVSVNGVVYVASVRRVVGATGMLSRRWCPIAEGVLIGVIAVIVGASIWTFAMSLSAFDRAGPLLHVVEGAASGLPLAVGVGIAAGAITGMLLELFDFEWVDDL